MLTRSTLVGCWLAILALLVPAAALVCWTVVVLFWTLRPRNRKKFDEAARIPLRED